MKRYGYKFNSIATGIPISTKQYEKTAKELEMQLNELGADD